MGDVMGYVEIAISILLAVLAAVALLWEKYIQPVLWRMTIGDFDKILKYIRGSLKHKVTARETKEAMQVIEAILLEIWQSLRENPVELLGIVAPISTALEEPRPPE
jgi:hypothetical protein